MTPDPEPSEKELLARFQAIARPHRKSDYLKLSEELHTCALSLETRLNAALAENAALRAEIESHSFEISPAMVQARNDQLYAEVEDLRGIIEKAAGLCQSLAGHRLMQIAQGPRRILSILNAARKTTQP